MDDAVMTWGSSEAAKPQIFSMHNGKAPARSQGCSLTPSLSPGREETDSSVFLLPNRGFFMILHKFKAT